MTLTNPSQVFPVGVLYCRQRIPSGGCIRRPVAGTHIRSRLASVLTRYLCLSRTLGISQAIPARMITVTIGRYDRFHSFSFRRLYQC